MVILEEIDNEERDRSFGMLTMTNDFQVQLNMFLLKKYAIYLLWVYYMFNFI